EIIAVDGLDDVAVPQSNAIEDAVLANGEEPITGRLATLEMRHRANLSEQLVHVVERGVHFRLVDDILPVAHLLDAGALALRGRLFSRHRWFGSGPTGTDTAGGGNLNRTTDLGRTAGNRARLLQGQDFFGAVAIQHDTIPLDAFDRRRTADRFIDMVQG